MLSGICLFRATWRLFIVFLVSYLSYPLNSGVLQRILLTSSCSSQHCLLCRCAGLRN